ncbi:MAG: efflux transporter SaoE [Clostridium sp.]
MIIDFIQKVLITSFDALKSSADWLIISFIFAGILRNFVSPEKFQRMLGNNKLSSIFKSILSAVLLPICSCGTFPIAISMYYSGAYLGPTLTFLTANPILNPIAILLCVGLLGPSLTIIYVITGLVISICVGCVGNRFGGSEVSLISGEVAVDERIELEEATEIGFFEKVKTGVQWAFKDLAMMVSKYVVLGMLLVGVLLTLSEVSGFHSMLVDPNIASLGSIAILAGIMYVCAVGHIPFIAALIATGVAPGVAITFLMAGAATNLPELMTLYKVVGKKSVIIYFSIVVFGSIIGGYVANLILMPGFTPVLDYNKITGSIEMANKLTINFPESIKILCCFIILILGFISVYRSIKSYVLKLRRV